MPDESVMLFIELQWVPHSGYARLSACMEECTQIRLSLEWAPECITEG
jgi:hypothetical protein